MGNRGRRPWGVGGAASSRPVPALARLWRAGEAVKSAGEARPEERRRARAGERPVLRRRGHGVLAADLVWKGRRRL
jgi:hypothetical protein